MKPIHILAIVLMTISPLCQIAAQSAYNSKKESLQGVTSDQELTCEYNSRYIVSYSHSNSSSVLHYFTIQDMDATVSRNRRFQINIGSDPGGLPMLPTIRYEVSDMRISDNKICYFCGTRIKENPLANPTTDSVGFIGMFSIQKFIDSLLIETDTELFTILIIDGTGSLSRIEPRGSYKQVFAVGYSDGYSNDPFNGTPASFLVGLEYDYQNSNWYYDIAMPILYTEQFNDVVNCDGGIITSSRYIGDNYHIGLRHTKNGPLHENTYLSMLNNCNKYDMQTATNSLGGIVAYRKNNDSILMTSKGSSFVTMAHSCYNVANGIAAYQLYEVGYGDIQISQARYTFSSDYISLKDLTTRLGDNKALFLATNNTGTTSMISRTDWLSTGSTFLYSEIAINSSNLACKSLETFYRNPGSSEYIYINGLTTSNQPTFFAETFNTTPLFFSCLPGTNMKTFVKLQTPSYLRLTGTSVECLYQHEPVNEIITTSVTGTPVTTNTTCNH